MSEHTPGPWAWQGEDYRGGWGWQILVGPKGEGLIVGQGPDGGPCEHLKAYTPVDPALCVTGLTGAGKERVEPVHVFSEANARLIAAAPDLLEALRGALNLMYCKAGPEWYSETCDCVACEAIRFGRAAIAKAEGK